MDWLGSPQDDNNGRMQFCVLCHSNVSSLSQVSSAHQYALQGYGPELDWAIGGHEATERSPDKKAVCGWTVCEITTKTVKNSTSI